VAGIYLDADADAPDLDGLLSAAGHRVILTTAVGRRRAHDDEQLVYAAQNNLILVTFNGRDFLILQRAWRHWADHWSVEPRPLHAGILVPRQPPQRTFDEIARDIDGFVQSVVVLRNRFVKWVIGRGWVQDG
jgi:hypothetical protein